MQILIEFYIWTPQVRERLKWNKSTMALVRILEAVGSGYSSVGRAVALTPEVCSLNPVKLYTERLL